MNTMIINSLGDVIKNPGPLDVLELNIPIRTNREILFEVTCDRLYLSIGCLLNFFGIGQTSR